MAWRFAWPHQLVGFLLFVLRTVVIPLPDNWQRMKDDEPFKVVQLSIGCKEFMDVEDFAKKTAQGAIHEIRVNQNYHNRNCNLTTKFY